MRRGGAVSEQIGDTVGTSAGADGGSAGAVVGGCRFCSIQRSGLRRLTPLGAGKIELREEYLCTHPFHGLPLPLGESASEAAGVCSGCRLPRDPQPGRRTS